MRRFIFLFCAGLALACEIGGDIATVLNGITAPSIGSGDVTAEPPFGRRNTLIPVTFTGTFSPETWVVVGDGITADAVNQPNATQIQAAIRIDPDAPFGPQFLRLVNRNGEQLTARFVVQPRDAPTLTGVEPFDFQSGTTTSVTLTGTNFASGLSLVDLFGGTVTGDLDNIVSNVNVVNSETITARVRFSAQAIGTRQIRVINGSDQSESYLLRVFSELAPPGPAISAMTPTTFEAGRSFPVKLSGTGFVPGATTILVSPADGVQVSSVVADATTVGATFTISSTARPGRRDVFAATQVVSRAVPIQITQPTYAEIAFRASPPTITRGQPSTLSWNVAAHPDTLATQCALFIGAQKLADVSCRSGEHVVRPTTTTEYKLTVLGNNLSDWATTAVVVQDSAPAAPSSNSQTFATPGTFAFTVPAGVSQLTLETSGASGGAGAGSTPSNAGSAGGRGGRVTATVAVTPGETLTVVVGVGGSNAVLAGAFGFGGNGAGIGGNGGGTGAGGGGGGGGSSVSRGGTVLVLAGGGGGGGGNFGLIPGGIGGGGGGTGAAASGQTAELSAAGGSGATPASAGTGGAGAGHPGGNGATGAGQDGGVGGSAATASSGAGGGGGGGAFGGGGGGGGSQFSGTAQSGGGGGGGSSTAIGSATGVTHQQGVQSGNGLVVIRW